MRQVPGGGKERSAHVSVGLAVTDKGDPLYVKKASFPLDLARALGIDPRRVKLLGVRSGDLPSESEAKEPAEFDPSS